MATPTKDLAKQAREAGLHEVAERLEWLEGQAKPFTVPKNTPEDAAGVTGLKHLTTRPTAALLEDGS